MKTSTKIFMCLGGVALVVLGVLCIVYPGSTLLSLAWAFGLMLIFSGCSTFGVWAMERHENPFGGLTFLAALLQILFGCLLLANPAPLAVAITFIFAFWVLYGESTCCLIRSITSVSVLANGGFSACCQC